MKTPKIFASLLSLALVAGFTVSSSATKAEALDPSAPCYSYFYQYPVTPAIVNNTVTCLTVTNASFYSQNLFTVTTWNYFQDQLDMVPLYLSIGMQEEALTGLNFGVDALAYRGNTTSLQATVNSLPGYGDSALYTTATWDDYWDAN
ncbi:MAG: hypothetical protein LBR20_05985, partial [Propionibacteriaceae bacterium]|nr:hypothetical protein [Propionibacteriaceae bacterium]